MALLVGDGFYLPTALGVAGVAAQGTVLTSADLGQVYSIQTNANLAGSNSIMHTGDGIVVDTDDDGDFTDEASTTQTDNDRYIDSVVTYADGSSSTVTLELITLSNGSQAILMNDGSTNSVNAAADEIQTITLGTFNTRFDNRYHQGNFNNTITNTVVCFCEQTLLQTPSGEQKIGNLKAGDEIVTAKEGTQKIAWIGKRTVTTAQLVASPHLKPIRIRAGALEDGVPSTDLLVSPQHRILLVSKIAERMFGQKEILVPAIKLVGSKGIEQVTSAAPVTYTHLMFDKHQIVFANGAPAESLFTGPQALKALSDEAREEIAEIFPELKQGVHKMRMAHPSVQKQVLVNKLVARHAKNNKQLVSLDIMSGPKSALHPCSLQ